MRISKSTILVGAASLVAAVEPVSCALDAEGTGAFLEETGGSGGAGAGGSGGSTSSDDAGGGAGFAGSGAGGSGGSVDDAGQDGDADASGKPEGGDADADDGDAAADGDAEGSLTCADDPCGLNMVCDDTAGDVICTCLDGYEFDGSGSACVDIDECVSNTHDCSPDATCANEMGSFSCMCNPGMIGDGKLCRLPRSCADLAREVPGQLDGQYVIDPDGPLPLGTLNVYCDMTSDDGVGYTMVKFDDPTLLDHQDGYHEVCAAHGLGLIVPRTRAHARAIVAWLGAPPNVVGVYPRKDGDKGLDQFVGRCEGVDCSFYMSDTNGSDCQGDEPNGNSKTAYGLVRRDDSNACGFWGRWDDNNEHVELEGWVVCSTNDAGPVEPRASCQAYMATESVWNKSARGITGTYSLDPDGAGPRPTVDVVCDQRRDDGGWTLAFVTNADYGSTYETFCAADENLSDLALSPEASSAEHAARHGWFNLNDFAFDALRLAAYDNGTESFLSAIIGAASLRIPFGTNGYFLFDDANGYYWCAGASTFTDDGAGQLNPPLSAPDDCKGHANLGSGWDFSSGLGTNLGLTLCGSDGAAWMSADAAGKRVDYGHHGAAQAIWVR